MDQKRVIRIFVMTPESLITRFSDLLVYGALAYRASKEVESSASKLALVTGLGRRGVTSSIERLTSIGLLGPEGVRLNRDWFRVLPSLHDSDTHWSLWLQNWSCYIRTPGCEAVSPVDIGLYSYVRHRVESGGDFRPTIAYLATCLRITKDTVHASLDRLSKAGFLRYQSFSKGGVKIQLYRTLDEPQLACLQDKKQTTRPIQFTASFCDDLPSGRDEERRRHFNKWWDDELHAGFTLKHKDTVYEWLIEQGVDDFVHARSSVELTGKNGWVPLTFVCRERLADRQGENLAALLKMINNSTFGTNQ